MWKSDFTNMLLNRDKREDLYNLRLFSLPVGRESYATCCSTHSSMIGSPGGSFITQSCILLGQSALFDYTDTLGVYKGDFFERKQRGEITSSIHLTTKC
jgi:hypothetical protein